MNPRDAGPSGAAPWPPEGQRGPCVKATGALVIGGDYRGLGTVRSLGRRGIPVWVVVDEHRIAATSRYARRRLQWPQADDAGRVAWLLDLAETCGLQGWALFPTGDVTTTLLAQHRSALSERFLVTVAPWEVIRWAQDKRLTYRLAADLGVGCPWTWCPGDRAAVAAAACTFPVILKPAMKERINPFTYAKAWRVEDRDALLARYDDACSLVPAGSVLIQEVIPGGGELQLSYAALCLDGRPLASIVARRTRQYPMDFGLSSSYVEAIDRPDVEEPARRLLAAMRITGLVEVEFKQDPRDGQLKVLDINPRIWGWHTLGRRAGVDFSYLLWRLVHGEPVAQVRATAGFRWVRAVTDVLVAASEIRHGRMTLTGYLRSLRGPIEPAVFAIDDPLPALLDVPLLAHLAWSGRLRGAKGPPAQTHRGADPVGAWPMGGIAPTDTRPSGWWPRWLAAGRGGGSRSVRSAMGRRG